MKALLALLLVSCGPLSEGSMPGARPPIPLGRQIRGGAITAQEERRHARVFGDRTAVGLPADFPPANTIDPMFTVNAQPFAAPVQIMSRLKVHYGYPTKSVSVGIYLPFLASVVIGAAIYRYDSGNNPGLPALTLLASGFYVVLNGSLEHSVVPLDRVVELDDTSAYVLMIYYDGTDPNVSATLHIAPAHISVPSSLEYTASVITPESGFPSRINFSQDTYLNRSLTVFAYAIPQSGFGLIY